MRGIPLGTGVPDDFLIITPDELMKLYTRQSRSLVAMLTFVSAVSLFVSGVVIMNIMLVAVSERAYEIGCAGRWGPDAATSSTRYFWSRSWWRRPAGYAVC